MRIISLKNGFKHTAILHKNGFPLYSTDVKYVNRTWERFEYETILKKVVNAYFECNEDTKTAYIEQIKGGF